MTKQPSRLTEPHYRLTNRFDSYKTLSVSTLMGYNILITGSQANN
jgi:hypothetical protein